MFMIFFRTILIYLFLICVLRLMGKRQIGELQLSELVTALLLSELVSKPITDTNTPMSYAVLPILVLICLEIINTFVVTKCVPLRRFLDGTPSILIREGVLNQKEMSRVRLTVEELLAELRQKNIASISEVGYAIMEQNGRLSVFPKVANRAATPEDLQLSPQEKGVAHPLVVDGHISQYNLNLCAKSEAWLLGRIRANRCTLKDVFLFTLDDAGNEFLIRKV